MGGHGVVNGARYGRNGGFVKYHVRASKQGRDGGVIADVGTMKFNAAAHLVQVRRMAGEQVVDDNHVAGAFRQQSAYNRGADEAGASGNDVMAHVGSWEISRSMWRSDSLAIRS